MIHSQDFMYRQRELLLGSHCDISNHFDRFNRDYVGGTHSYFSLEMRDSAFRNGFPHGQ